jgi:hypothetical protein
MLAMVPYYIGLSIWKAMTLEALVVMKEEGG